MVATRYVAGEVGPASLACMRYALAVLCLVPFLIASGRPRIAPRDALAVALLGIVQFGLLIALLNFGLRHMSATRAALLFATFPLLTMLVAAALGRESLTRRKSAGVLLALAGVGIALGEAIFSPAGEEEWIGALAVLGSALCGAVCSVLYRPYLGRCPTLWVGAIAMSASVLFLAPLSWPEGLFSAPPVLDGLGWASVLFIGLSSGAGYLLWLGALKHASPTKVTVFLSLSPVTAAVLGVLLLGEPLTPATALGTATVVLGLIVATR